VRRFTVDNALDRPGQSHFGEKPTESGEIQFLKGGIQHVKIINWLGTNKIGFASKKLDLTPNELFFLGSPLFANVSSRIARKESGFITDSSSLNGWVVSLIARNGRTLPVKWELEYKASRNGFGVKEFHQKCDGEGKYVVVVKAINNRIAIAYNGDGFRFSSSFGQHTANKNGFILSMKQDGSYGTQFDRNAGVGYGIRNFQVYGPMFGFDDLNIMMGGFDDLNIMMGGRSAYSYLGSGYGEGPEANDTTLFGQERIDVSDYEVFKITIE
jgi:hypothetical protein